MEYEVFKEALLKALEESLGGDIALEYAVVPRNNKEAYEGLHILNPDRKIMPVFNVEKYYRMYFEEEKDFDSIVEELLEHIKNAETEQENMTCQVEMLDEVRENVYFALVNYEANRKRLKEIPHERFLDLAVVLYVCMEPGGDRYLSMMITAPLMQLWGTDFETLYEAAKKNAVEKQPAEIMELKDIVRMIEGEKLRQGMQKAEPAEEKRKKVFFLSNSAKTFGAACILYPGVLQKLADEVEADLYIAPVSVHEVMIFPDIDVDAQWLKERVAFASGESEGEKDWLSNTLYRYDLEKGEINICE